MPQPIGASFILVVLRRYLRGQGPCHLMFLLSASLIGCTTVDHPPAPSPVHHAAYSSFYIAAHPDDIELFMARNAWTDMAVQGSKTIFVILTAGDDGHGAEGVDGRGPYYLAREEGHLRAIRFWASLNGQPVPATKTERVTISGRSLERQSIGDAIVIYDLDLPDGNPEGTGYQKTGYQSLSRLRSNQIPSITSVDGRLSLTLAQLEELMKGLIAYEAHGFKNVFVSIQDEDSSINPVDHPDHKATAGMVVDSLSAPPYECMTLIRYITYSTSAMPVNLSPSDLMIHERTWEALNSGLVDHGYADERDATHEAWIGKQYFRIQKRHGVCDL